MNNLSKFFGKVYDNRQATSWSTNLREKRAALFLSLIEPLPRPLKILDVGGTGMFWVKGSFLSELERDVEITVLNVKNFSTTHPKIKSLIGDARHMPQFKTDEFDVVFSNSVIEHVGDFTNQMKMANEIRRVGKKYFVQTPNIYFPIEPHFLFPFYQFLPLWLRIWLISHFNLGWRKKARNKQKALEEATSVQLLNKKQLINLFPDGKIVEEKVFGLTKSFIVCGGWNMAIPLIVK